MSLSPEMIAIANQEIAATFANTSLLWQVLPQWDVGDPAQSRIMADQVVPLPKRGTVVDPVPGVGPFGGPPGGVLMVSIRVPFTLTYAQADASTSDALLTNSIEQATELARLFDRDVVHELEKPALNATNQALNGAGDWYIELNTGQGIDASTIISGLVHGRESLEESGYRSASVLLASRPHFTDLHRLHMNRIAIGDFLIVANASGAHRTAALNKADDPFAEAPDNRQVDRMLMIGRRQDIPPRGGPDASPGEEPVDLAVTVGPSLEVVGDDKAGLVHLAVRIKYAVRIKDARGIVVFHST